MEAKRMEAKKIVPIVLVAGVVAFLAVKYWAGDEEEPSAGRQPVGTEGEIEPEPEVVVTPEEWEQRMVEAVAALKAEGKDLENYMALTLSTGGPVIIELMPDKAPNHVARFKVLAREGFFDGIVFHRVIEGFMAQTGDPTGTGSGGSGVGIDAEFNDVMHVRGIVSTARSTDPNSADSQFFIMFDEAPHLDNQYTVWGRVVSGMDFVDKLARGDRAGGGVVPVEARDKMVTVKVAADVELP